ncbi:MAG: hypothetical protein M9894_03165 [Planctomycetes bacterium]|nr:hypothetical protein [Planctomycetota bacterium]
MTALRRTPGLLVALALLGVVPCLAQDRLAGRVAVTASGGVTVGARPVAGALAETLRPLVGREVVVEGDRVVRPERTEVRGTRLNDAFVVDSRRLTLTGPAADLVPRGRVAILDVWLLEGDEVVVVGVEGRTTGDWNLVHAHPRWPSPAGLVRGKKPVWVLARGDGRLLVQRGDTRGWVAAESVVLGEAPSAGLVDGLPR